MKKELWFCDGCDKQLQPNEVEVRWSGVGTCADAGAFLGGPYDLCLGCSSRLETEMNPKSWTRVKPFCPDLQR